MESMLDEIDEERALKEELEGIKYNLGLQIEDLNREKVQLINEKSKTEDHCRKTDAEVNQLKSELQTEKNISAQSQKLQKKLQSQFEELQVRYENEHSQMVQTEKTKRKVEGEIKDIKQKLYDETSRIKQEQTSTSQMLSKDLEKFKAQLEDEQKQKWLLEASKRQIEIQRNELQEILDDTTQKKDRFQKSHHDTLAELEDVRRQLEEKTNEEESLNQQLKATKDEFENLKKGSGERS